MERLFTEGNAIHGKCRTISPKGMPEGETFASSIVYNVLK